jgi:hypothetical protein
MNSNRSFANRALPLALLVVGVSIGSGCATRGYVKAQDTSISLTTAASQVEASRQQLVNTTASLSALVNQSTPDLRVAFERYRTAVDALERNVNAVNVEAENMQRQGQQYFAAWDAELAKIQNENIRARSAGRQQEVAQQFARIQEQYSRVRQQFPLLLSRLRDIQRLVGVDLTPTGVRTAQDFAARAEGDAAALRQTLDQLATDFRAMSGVLAPVALPGT